MTSQAIEGTGMTLRMSGGWTSDIVEMQLPYVVRQAIDDTHLGDTIIRWIPSKDIEYGTMAIRFWHDPDNILPITGQPETMVITYPDGINHLAVIGYVEKIGKESIKVGELMQTDAMVRILHYPKMPSVSDGSFPLFSSSIISKVVTDIMETATLRYLVDSSPTNYSTLVATNGGYNLTPIGVNPPFAYNEPSGIFGKRAARSTSVGAAYENDSVASLIGIGRPCTLIWVARMPASSSSSNDESYFGTIRTAANQVGWGCKRSSGSGHQFTLRLGGIVVWASSYSTSDRSVVLAARWKSDNSWIIYVNGVDSGNGSYAGGQIPTTLRFTFKGGWPYIFYRDFAFWNYALSDTDFETLNDQLCAEYGIT